MGALRWRAFGGAGVAGGVGALATVGVAGNAAPFLMRRSPLLELSCIWKLAGDLDPTHDRLVFLAVDAQSIFGDNVSIVRASMYIG